MFKIYANIEINLYRRKIYLYTVRFYSIPNFMYLLRENKERTNQWEKYMTNIKGIGTINKSGTPTNWIRGV